jgi:signal transduction histidine kinase/ActR/RegA family two-component response regulator
MAALTSVDPSWLDPVPLPMLLGHQDERGLFRVDYATPSWLQLHGVDPEGMVSGRPLEAVLAESLHASDLDAALTLLHQALRRTSPVQAQWRIQVREETRLMAVQVQAEPWNAQAPGGCRRWSLVEQDVSLQFESAVRARTLSRELQSMALVAQKASNLVVFFDRDWRVRWVNEGACAITGLPRELAIGLVCDGYLKPELKQAEPLSSLHRPALERGESVVLDARLRNHRQQPYSLRLELQALFDEQGRWDGVLAMGLDTTAQQQLQQALADALRSAQAANLAKDEFLSNMSHELRTPLSTVLGMADLLQMDKSLPDQQRSFVGAIRSAGAGLLGVLNDILLYTKLEAGYQRVVSEPVHMQAVLDQVQGLFLPRAAEKGLQLSFTCEAEVLAPLLGDALRLSQVLSNYVDNALKFTTAGSVAVRVACEQQDERSVLLKCVVQDTGIGIRAEDQDGLFQPFRQVDGSASRSQGGTGLGLSICNKLADLMGGQVGVDSAEGRGSCFWFTARLLRPQQVPAVEPVSAAVSSTSPVPAHQEGAFAGARIMVVDDVPSNVEVVAAYLRYLGVEVTMCGGGLQAVELAQTQSFDMILMDMQMPDLDGMLATQAIHTQPANAHLPVVAISAGILPSDVAQARRAGMLDHLGKPVRFDQLYAVLQRYLPQPIVRQTP